jgi:apolipoprotein N-acyltransferase
MMGYGFWKSSAFEIPQDAEGSIRVALVQGARDVRFGLTAEEDQRETVTNFRSHQALTARAREANADLVIWAESMFPVTDVLPFDADKYLAAVAQPNAAEPSARPRLSLETLETVQREMLFLVRETTGTGPVGVYPYQSSVPLVVGMRSLDPLGDSDYNAAVYFDANSEVAGRYFKTHLVPFGEYLPLGETFPVLYSLAPMPRGLTPGDGAKVFEVQGKRFLPTICYESVIGRLVRRYLVDDPNANPDLKEEDSTANELSRFGESSTAMDKTANGKSEQEPTNARSRCDALLNISNDGWFWGSSALDLHLASNVFRAVENRTPHLVVCNTGISAQIDASGRIVQEASKRSAELLMVDVYRRPVSWNPLWWTVGNGPWWVLTALIGFGLWRSAVGSRRSGR